MNKDSAIRGLRDALIGKPKIVCICGSMKFEPEMRVVAETSTLCGKIVLMPHVSKQELAKAHGVAWTNARAKMLDELHRRKIAMADEVLIVNVGDYIGESTQKELDYAKSLGKRIIWWETHVEKGS